MATHPRIERLKEVEELRKRSLEGLIDRAGQPVRVEVERLRSDLAAARKKVRNQRIALQRLDKAHRALLYVAGPYYRKAVLGACCIWNCYARSAEGSIYCADHKDMTQ